MPDGQIDRDVEKTVEYTQSRDDKTNKRSRPERDFGE